jgi:hypothetical protein
MNFKDIYQHQWEASNAKEYFLKTYIEQHTNLKVDFFGLGAGSTEYISTPPPGHKPGDADLYLPEIDTYIEITGPNIQVNDSEPLWIRPDKLNNSFKKLKNNQGRLHIIAHFITTKQSKQIIRIINLDNFFFSKAKEFEKIKPYINKHYQEFISIPHNHKVVKQLNFLIPLLTYTDIQKYLK